MVLWAEDDTKHTSCSVILISKFTPYILLLLIDFDYNGKQHSNTGDWWLCIYSCQQQLSKNSIMDYLNSKIQLFLEIELLDLFYWLLLLMQLPSSSSMYMLLLCLFSQSIRRMGMISDANTTYFFFIFSQSIWEGYVFLCLTTFGDWISMFSFVCFILGFSFSCEFRNSPKEEGGMKASFLRNSLHCWR